MNILLKEAVPEQAQAIARLIMQAMNYDCCQYFAGPDHTLADFERVMIGLVRRTDTQYSYRNTIVAVDVDADEERPVGIMVSYDGGRLHELRRAFIEAARIHFAQDFSQMEDETGPGEFYLDSMAVEEAYRGHARCRPEGTSTGAQSRTACRSGQSFGRAPLPSGGLRL